MTWLQRPAVLVLLAAAVNVATVSRSFSQDRNQAEQSDSFKVGSRAELLVRNVSGATRITAGAAGQVLLHAVKRASPRSADPAGALAAAEVVTHTTANRVEVRVESRSDRNRDVASVDLDIVVPPDCAVDLRSVSGDVRVTRVGGELWAENVSGDITLDSTPRIVRAKAVSGTVRITEGGSETNAEMETVSGDIIGTNLHIRAVDLKTVSGDVRFTGAAIDRVTFRSVSGALEYSGTLASGGRYDMSSHSGGIRLALDKQPGFEVDATTFSGAIRIDFPTKSEGLVRAGRGPRSLSLASGTYGDGSASVHAQTFSGSITIAPR